MNQEGEVRVELIAVIKTYLTMRRMKKMKKTGRKKIIQTMNIC